MNRPVLGIAILAIVASLPPGVFAEQKGADQPAAAVSHAQGEVDLARRGAARLALRADRFDPGWELSLMLLGLVALLGIVAAAARKLAPIHSTAAARVVGRIPLSPKHALYLLEIGDRRLLLGTGPQAAPSLITELEPDSTLERTGPTPGRPATQTVEPNP
jgi:flagellar biogenesis protein FliO